MKGANSKSSARVIVVSGTDTEIGKTLVGCATAHLLGARGFHVCAVKPVESGTQAAVQPDEDGRLLAISAGQAAPTEALTRLRAPLAPPVAADLEGVTLDMERWCEQIAKLREEADLVLVEGAGGLRSPLTWSADTKELARRLGASVLVVAADRLGTLNHTLLVLESLRAAKLPLVGVVYSTPERSDMSTGRNAEALRRHAGIQRVVELPRVGGWREAAGHLEEVADWVLGE